ncbi:hypothetical protein GX888_02660 [Candidatus Dojkabacteria bacterium]|uniref:DNA-binding response regulator n=1 Tax=Candidatus Dojkabacteria bacterium TaxID=2099670 RepID=A0A847VE45_9BACT|nr:hypothetical protein [Candidatus Dojkabacteria bacterium]
MISEVDIDLVCINIIPFSKEVLNLILTIKRKRLDTRIFCVLPDKKEIILSCISHGIDDFILNDSYNKLSFTCRVERLLHDKPFLKLDIKYFNNIYLNLVSGEMYLRGKMIRLTGFECVFLDYIIEKNGICNLIHFAKYYNHINKKNISTKCLIVYINRLKRKIYTLTGEKIIKSRYGYGYYLDA